MENGGNDSSAMCAATLASLRASDTNGKLNQILSTIQKKVGGVNVSCRPCSSEGVEAGARAFLMNSVPLTVTLCTNRLKNEKKDIEEALMHELVHAYDYVNGRCDFSTCNGLAYTEVRAAKAAECNGEYLIPWFKANCIKNHATKSTANLFPTKDAIQCVEKVYEAAAKDNAPFE